MEDILNDPETNHEGIKLYSSRHSVKHKVLQAFAILLILPCNLSE